MTKVRTGIFEFRGADAPVIGEDIRMGQQAPDFTAHTTDWTTVEALKSTQGKVRILGSLPSIHTSVCGRETRRFNQEASALSSEIVVIMVSMDLPYGLREWCAASGVERVITLSDHMQGEFGEKYGVLLKNQRVFRRAILVVDREDTVVYVDYMPKLGDEPDYAKVLSAAKTALGN
jgi:thiol peroxidase